MPRGVRVDEAINLLIAEGQLEARSCLVGFPHPSGTSGHKTSQWATNKSKLKRKVTVWFGDHPLDEPVPRPR